MTADLARYLINKGFSIIDLDQHRKDPKVTIFIFNYTKELQDAMDIYFDVKKMVKHQTA